MLNPVKRLAEPLSVEIANSASLSSGLNLGGRIPVGIYMPASWTAADLTFQASHDGSAWADLHAVAGGELEVGAAASIYLALDPVQFFGVSHLKIRSGTSASPVAQGGARALVLMLGIPVTE